MLPNKEKLQEYIDILACIMRIQDWDIEIELVNDNEMYGIIKKEIIYGCNKIDRSRKLSKIYINEELLSKENDDMWYHTLIHELCHLIHDDLDDWVEEHIDDKWESNYKVEMERNVNRFTRIFCSIYPVESLEEE